MFHPLRERPEDIPPIALDLLERMRDSFGLPDALFSPATLVCLPNYRWPGNVRQLKTKPAHAHAGAGRRAGGPGLLSPQVLHAGDESQQQELAFLECAAT